MSFDRWLAVVKVIKSQLLTYKLAQLKIAEMNRAKGLTRIFQANNYKNYFLTLTVRFTTGVN